jgi:hypothetical protein
MKRRGRPGRGGTVRHTGRSSRPAAPEGASADRGGSEAVAYPLVEPASHYYRVMTRGAWMPVLVGERI